MKINPLKKLLGIVAISFIATGCTTTYSDFPTTEKIIKQSGIENTPYRLDFFGDFKLENRPGYNQTRAIDFMENVCAKGLAKCKIWYSEDINNRGYDGKRLIDITADNYKEMHNYLVENVKPKYIVENGKKKPLGSSNYYDIRIYIEVSDISKSKILDSDIGTKIFTLLNTDQKALINLRFNGENQLFTGYSAWVKTFSEKRINYIKAMIEAILRYQNKDVFTVSHRDLNRSILYPLTNIKSNPNGLWILLEYIPERYEYSVNIGQSLTDSTFRSMQYHLKNVNYQYYISINGSYNPVSIFNERTDPDTVVEMLYKENPEEIREAIILLYQLLKN